MNRLLVSLGKALAISAMLGFGLVMAQAEPTLDQIYQAAKAGKVEEAQVMVQQVLVKHPNSGKAHFVQAELFARQGQLARAREALASADKLAPGLPFANSQAIQSLRAQLAQKTAGTGAQEPARSSLGSAGGNVANQAAAPVNVPSSGSRFPVGLGLALGGAAIALVVFLTRRKPAPPVKVNQDFSPGMQGGGLSGPQTFGGAAAGSAMQPGYGQAPNQQPGYSGQPGYAQQPAGSGMGGRLAGGLATGLAVGAGVMAAETIGRNLMGGNAHAATPPLAATDSSSNAGNAAGAGNSGNAFTGNNDMGGNDFGIGDAGSWDDGGSGSGDGGGGGDWDS